MAADDLEKIKNIIMFYLCVLSGRVGDVSHLNNAAAVSLCHFQHKNQRFRASGMPDMDI